MNLLRNHFELFSQSVDRLADFRSRIVLEHHHHLVFCACKNSNICSLYWQPNVAVVI